MNSCLSDLFFNHDLEHCEVLADDGFSNFDRDLLLQEAESFLLLCRGIGFTEDVTPDELVSDFMGRL